MLSWKGRPRGEKSLRGFFLPIALINEKITGYYNHVTKNKARIPSGGFVLILFEEEKRMRKYAEGQAREVGEKQVPAKRVNIVSLKVVDKFSPKSKKFRS